MGWPLVEEASSSRKLFTASPQIDLCSARIKSIALGDGSEGNHNWEQRLGDAFGWLPLAGHKAATVLRLPP